MLKRKFALVSVVLVLGVAAAQAAVIAPANEAFSTIDRAVEVKHKFCPIIIDCIKGKVGKCHYSTLKHRCVCRCVPRHEY